MSATVVRWAVRHAVRRARKQYRCNEMTCDARIEPGEDYVHLTAMPGHDAAPAWAVARRCSECAYRLDSPSQVVMELDRRDCARPVLAWPRR